MSGEKTVADFGPFRLEVDSSDVATAMSVFCDRLDNDLEAMGIVAGKLRDIAYTHMLTGDFLPLAPSTIERRKYAFDGAYGGRGPAQGDKPLVASGGSASRLHSISRKHYAAGARGNMDWYLFLSDRGLGRVDQRQFMFLTEPERQEITDLYEVRHVTPAIDAFNGDKGAA